jgi:hypothetical protein
MCVRVRVRAGLGRGYPDVSGVALVVFQRVGQSIKDEKTLLRFRNPFGIAQYINHPPGGTSWFIYLINLICIYFFFFFLFFSFYSSAFLTTHVHRQTAECDVRWLRIPQHFS